VQKKNGMLRLKVLQWLAIAFLLTSCASCTSSSNKVAKATTTKSVALKNDKQVQQVDYTSFKQQVVFDKCKLKESSTKAVSNFLYNVLSEDIYHYWKGTPWDFNGTTQKPGEGSIACGYFITNTLSDLGFKIQRTKLAQVVSSEMIKTLCADVKRFSDFEKFAAYFNSQSMNTVFVVGLDFHTGYVLHDSSGSYFMHSNYISNAGVIKEQLDKSQALIHNKCFVVGSLSNNALLLQKWVEE
jgi:hypothetical protein